LAAIHSQEPLSGETLLLESHSDLAAVEKVIHTSRKSWAKREAPSDIKNSKVEIDKSNKIDEPTIETVALPSKS